LTGRHALGYSRIVKPEDRLTTESPLGARGDRVGSKLGDGGIKQGKENGLNEPQAVDRLEVRDLLVRAFGVIALLVVAFLAVYAI
jgi:hypothetical protein